MSAEEYIFGSQLKRARILAGLSQVELEKKAGCKIAHLENESRLPSFESLVKICVALDVSADLLIFGKVDNAEETKRSRVLGKIIRLINQDILDAPSAAQQQVRLD